MITFMISLKKMTGHYQIQQFRDTLLILKIELNYTEG